MKVIGAEWRASLEPALVAAVAETARDAADVAADLAPVKSGALAASIRAEGAAVVAGAPYAAAVELGTLRQPARPFLRPALLQVRERMWARVAALFGRSGA